MSTEAVGKETVETDQGLRRIWQELEDQQDILQTGILAVEVLEADHWTDSYGPVASTLQGALNQLGALLTEIQENPDVLNSRQVPRVYPERSEDDPKTDS